MKRDLTNWVLGIWRGRGIVADRPAADEWLKGQDVGRLKRLMEGGGSVKCDPRLLRVIRSR